MRREGNTRLKVIDGQIRIIKRWATDDEQEAAGLPTWSESVEAVDLALTQRPSPCHEEPSRHAEPYPVLPAVDPLGEDA